MYQNHVSEKHVGPSQAKFSKRFLCLQTCTGLAVRQHGGSTNLFNIIRLRDRCHVFPLLSLLRNVFKVLLLIFTLHVARLHPLPWPSEHLCKQVFAFLSPFPPEVPQEHIGMLHKFHLNRKKEDNIGLLIIHSAHLRLDGIP